MRGIYAIWHRASSKAYVGSSISIKQRWADHRKALRARAHHSPKLQNAWNKYGPEAFEFVVLESVLLLEDLVPREQHWMDRLNAHGAGYNIRPNAANMLGFRHSQSTKEKCRAANLGRPMPDHVKETLRKANTGRTLSDEHVAKIAAGSRRKHSPESVAKVVAAHLGAKRSDEARQRMSDAMKGKRNWLGRKHSDATKQRISEAKSGKSPRPAHTKLTDQNVLTMRRLYVEGVTFKELGHRFGVAKPVALRAVRGVTFAQVPGAVPLPPHLRPQRRRAQAIERGQVDADGVIQTEEDACSAT